MRVGIDVRALQADTGSSARGIGRYVTDLVEGLAKFHAHEMHLTLFVRAERDLPAFLELPHETNFVAIEGRMWSDHRKPWWTKVPKLRSLASLQQADFDRLRAQQRHALSRAVNESRVDLVHLPSAVDVGSYAELDTEIPVVKTFLDAIVWHCRAEMYDRMPPHLRKYYDAQLNGLREAQAVVAISNASAQDAIKLAQVPAEQVHTVYPSISDVWFRPPAKERVDRFVFNSVPDPHKNAERVLRAFAQLDSRFELDFIAPMQSAITDRLASICKELKIEDRVHFTGFVQLEEMVEMYRRARALVSPSLIEGFGLPVAQAMACGTPVVTSNRSAQAEISVGAAIQVDPESVSEIAAAMATLATSDVTEHISRGQVLAEKFRAQVPSNALAELYAQLVS